MNGKFEDVSRQAGPDFAVSRANRGVGVGDFDSDGRLDLVISVLGERPLLLHNVSDAAERVDRPAAGRRGEHP